LISSQIDLEFINIIIHHLDLNEWDVFVDRR
jgi:hypothetical protein